MRYSEITQKAFLLLFFAIFFSGYKLAECQCYGFQIGTNCWANAANAELYISTKEQNKVARYNKRFEQDESDKQLIMKFLEEKQLIESSTVKSQKNDEAIYFYNISKKQLHFIFIKEHQLIKYKRFLKLFPGELSLFFFEENFCWFIGIFMFCREY